VSRSVVFTVPSCSPLLESGSGRQFRQILIGIHRLGIPLVLKRGYVGSVIGCLLFPPIFAHISCDVLPDSREFLFLAAVYRSSPLVISLMTFRALLFVGHSCLNHLPPSDISRFEWIAGWPFLVFTNFRILLTSAFVRSLSMYNSYESCTCHSDFPLSDFLFVTCCCA
jgi:hypothetical protein